MRRDTKFHTQLLAAVYFSNNSSVLPLMEGREPWTISSRSCCCVHACALYLQQRAQRGAGRSPAAIAPRLMPYGPCSNMCAPLYAPSSCAVWVCGGCVRARGLHTTATIHFITQIRGLVYQVLCVNIVVLEKVPVKCSNGPNGRNGPNSPYLPR